MHFFVEDQAHGTEVMRACEREGLRPMALKADRDKLTRAIGAQPAFAAGKVYLPKNGGEKTTREMLEFPGGRQDNRVDCAAYAVQVWRERVRQLNAGPPRRSRPKERAEQHNVHPEERVESSVGKDRGGRWMP